ncbi:MAG TPA: beta-galactosidase, partial [Terriglobales bacterium]|nr:beta-galactosidase [Terriglobales bacterium]
MNSWPPHSIYFGADYYAEDYSADQVERDAAAMEKAGFNMVRMLDTNWAAIEPHDGQFTFGWLDRVLATLGRHGIRAILGVPSYVPPYWLLRAHPEIMALTRDGVRYRPGGMGGVDLLDPVYLRYVRRLDEALAGHYGHDARVVGWQIDNELGIWGSGCYNADCLTAFHAYLRRKFHSVETLNRTWGTVSYGHQFTSFDEVPLDWQPVAEGHQSSLEFEVRRFFTATQVEFVRRQAEVFRRLAPGQFITHNAPGPNLGCDYFRLARPLDFMSFDNYPGMGDHRQAMLLDLARGYNQGAPYLILEEMAGAPGPYTLSGPQPPPGQLRLWAYETLAHGADGVLFFRWRTARSGSEEFWQGLLDPAGDSTRRLAEISRT